MKNYQKIKDFLNLFINKPNTFKKHNKAIELFLLENPNINPETYLKDIRLLSKEEEYKIKDTIEKDLITFQQKLEDNYSPNTVKSYISSIRQLLEHNRIELDNAFWKKLNRLRTSDGNSYSDMTPTKQQIKKILSNSNSLEKALFLTLISTGLRPEEVINIEINDLHLEEKPPRINIKTISTNTKRRVQFTYTTEECKESIKLWLEQRQNYIEKTKKISNLPIKWETSNKLFPISEVTARKRWNKLLEKSIQNEESINKNGRKQKLFHLYTLRKYFRTYLGKRDLAEYFMGHRNMSNQYWNKPEEEIKKDYLEYSKNLYIYSNPTLPDEVQIELEEKDKEIVKLKGKIEVLTIQNNNINIKLTEVFNRLNHKTHPVPDFPGKHLETVETKTNKKGQRIDYDINLKKQEIYQVSKSRQRQINEHYKDSEEFWKTYDKILKENPNLSEQEIIEIIKTRYPHIH